MATKADEILSAADAAQAKSRIGAQAKTWRYAGRMANAGAVANYLNVAPAQQAGEAMVTVRDDNTVDVFAFF